MRRRSRAKGLETVEYGLIAGLLIAVVITLMATLGGYIAQQPELLLDRTIVIALVVAAFGGLVASAAWLFKQTVASLERRAQVVILEELSRGEAMSRDDIRRALFRESWLFWLCRDVHNDALATLLTQGKVVVEKGVYRATVAKEPGEATNPTPDS
jgi:hypothetical protein